MATLASISPASCQVSESSAGVISEASTLSPAMVSVGLATRVAT
jgi:hypothetical protein